MHRNIDRHAPLTLLGHQVDDASLHMLLAKPRAVATPQAGVEVDVEDQALLGAKRPALLEFLDHLHGPRQVTFAVVLLDRDAIGRVFVNEFVGDGKLEQAAHRMEKMSTLVLAARRNAFLDLGPRYGL